MRKHNMEINIKDFWEARGKKYKEVPFESLSNFEENPEILTKRIEAEKNVVFSKLKLSNKDRVLDLGAGVGQWAFRFAPLVKSVIAVEFATSQINIAKQEQIKRQINNIEFIESPAEKFIDSKQYDVIYISGLIVYLNERQIKELMKNLKSMLKDDGILFLREPSSILEERYEVIDQYSDALQTNYSAIYRTSAEIKSYFLTQNLTLKESGCFFSEESKLNKFPETKLMYYVFKKE